METMLSNTEVARRRLSAPPAQRLLLAGRRARVSGVLLPPSTPWPPSCRHLHATYHATCHAQRPCPIALCPASPPTLGPPPCPPAINPNQPHNARPLAHFPSIFLVGDLPSPPKNLFVLCLPFVA